jgi:predicted NAD-dependent protein-ADP-ribosyltransferase YbiA (DUF1768 family)
MQTCDTQLKEVNNKTVKLNQEYLLSQERCSMLEREFDAIRKDNEKLHSQEYTHMEKYELLTKEKRDSIDKLEETLNAERRRVQEAFDEILTLKMTLGAVGTDMVNSRPPSPFEKVKETPRQVKFKGEDDPLSNLFHVEEGIDMYCQRFYSTEAAYQYRGAIFSNNFEKAGEILDAKSAREAMELDNQVTKPKGWHDQKETEMKKVREKKAEKCPPFAYGLKKAAGKEIIEDTGHWFWGRGTFRNKGRNRMGHLLMDLVDKMYGEGIHGDVPEQSTFQTVIGLTSQKQEHPTTQESAGISAKQQSAHIPRNGRNPQQHNTYANAKPKKNVPKPTQSSNWNTENGSVGAVGGVSDMKEGGHYHSNAYLPSHPGSFPPPQNPVSMQNSLYQGASQDRHFGHDNFSKYNQSQPREQPREQFPYDSQNYQGYNNRW